MSSPRPSSPYVWFRDLGVRTKVLTAVTLAAAVALVVGVMGLRSLGASADAAQAIYETNLHAVEATADMEAAIFDMRQKARDALIAPTRAGTRAALSQMRSDLAEFDAAVDLYTEATGLSGSRRETLASLVAAVDDYLDQQDTVMAPLALAGDSDAWVAANDEVMSPLTTTMTESSDALTALERSDAAEAASAVRDTYQTNRLVVWALLAIGLVLSLGLGWWVSAALSRRVATVKHVVDALAEGDLTRRAGIDAQDEVGQMAASLDLATESLRVLLEKVMTSADTVATSSGDLSATSQQIAAGAEETSVQAVLVSEAAEEVSRNVATVAAGAEQMGASIREIAVSAAEAARVAAEAVSTVEVTNETVAKLGISSREIGKVVNDITAIAEQTSLLALNASIEAARAGQAGQGFAVVAGEVKQLAQQTARATEDIARRVETIQVDAGGAVEAMGEIAGVIGSISDYQTMIAAAVEEQTATTSDMSRSVAEASLGTGEIAQNVTGVSAAAETTTRALTQAHAAVDALAELAGSLRTSVGQFRT
ncbi:methyl-accepting chemotaxis protein [Nocardioides sp. GY 10113]|uniref:methyl-accepting chemotaxis protein n=1 Tax=Nocardioides sp. GY 10113 TaxID=2569761 RepID=UPI0010A926DF|nr:methyl-accepting chemotaxis protein [Nocardioides sp. GY 10113]TIC87524.1 methyl-accepting chemotaxis protein [Nocardioides sp. GY 10113]